MTYQAITVKYRGPTNSRCSKWVVADGADHSRISYDSGIPMPLRKHAAAVAHIAKHGLGQANGLVEGFFDPDTAVFVRTLPTNAGKLRLWGLEYNVLTTFPDTVDGTALANVYMEASTQGACHIHTDELRGLIYLAAKTDKGTPYATE